MRFETIAIHAGMDVDQETGALAPPLHLSTTFERDPSGQTSRGFGYIRDANPTQTRLEHALAALEGGEAALAFASGMAAASALLQALPPGSHVILSDDGYYAVRRLAAELGTRWGLSVEIRPLDDLGQLRGALRQPTRLVWIETPSNPLMKIVDIAAVASLAHAAGALVVVDGTFATPALQRPLSLGADFVLHSTTKYFGGHSDVQGGALVFARRDETFEHVEQVRRLVGGVASPFNSWLVLRGIRTLPARMRLHCDNAQRVAMFLAGHARVEAVFYPGLQAHAGHDVAARQMSGFGGMLSFLVRGGRDEALAVTSRTRLFTRATSLGGVESLIEHRASSEGPGSTTPDHLLRLSVGLEHPDDLIEDLDAALRG